MPDISINARRLDVTTVAVRKQDQILRYLMDHLVELRWSGIGSSLLPEPHYLELVGAELERLRRSQKFLDVMGAAQVHGACISLWIAQRDGMIVVPGASFAAAEPEYGLTPERAVEYWKKKLGLTDAQASELLADIEDAAALTALQAAQWSDAVLLEVSRLFARAIAEGLTLSDFRKAFTEIIPAQSRAHLESIYRTNISRTFNKKRFEDASAAPGTFFLQFLSIPDDRRTPVCKLCHGYIAGIASGVWQRLTPPLHWRCRSTVSPIPFQEGRRRGIVDYAANGQGVVFPLGLLPYGPPPVPSTILDLKGKRFVTVDVQPGFGGNGQQLPILSSRAA